MRSQPNYFEFFVIVVVDFVVAVVVDLVVTEYIIFNHGQQKLI